VLLWQGKNAKFRFATMGRELFDPPDPGRENKRGAVLIGAHLGSFDALRMLGSELTTPVHYVMHRAHAPHINRILKELNPDSNLRVVELSPGEIDGILKLKECVERGDHIAILGDRHPPGQKARGCKVSFLGHEASFPENAWILAHLLNCKIILALALRTGPRAYQVVAKSLTPDAPWIGDRDEFVRSHLRAFVKELEAVCCSYPFQWFNYYDFWSDFNDSTPATHQ
jgi:predicted LPLAT superfamily acyltransferase